MPIIRNTRIGKAAFYFVIAVMVLVDVVQSRYRANLMRVQEARGNA